MTVNVLSIPANTGVYALYRKPSLKPSIPAASLTYAFEEATFIFSVRG
jgi:hypothetical protein